MINGLQDSNVALYAVTAGAGTGLQDRLWMTPGTSRWLVGCRFLYAPGDTADFLGYAPDKFVSRDAAIALAVEALRRTAIDDAVRVRAGKPARRAIGLAVTAAVASLSAPPRRGGCRVHLALATVKGVTHAEIALAAGEGEVMRAHHNIMIDDAACILLERALGWDFRWRWPGGVEDVPDADVRAVVMTQPVFHRGHRGLDKDVESMALYPGAFNPIHAGHVSVCNSVCNSAYTICLDSPHKVNPPVTEIITRIARIQVTDPGRPVVLTTGDPLFIDKARRRPRGELVLSVDAFDRLLDPRWGVPVGELIKEFIRCDAMIHVASRTVDGVTETMDGCIDRLVAAGRLTVREAGKLEDVFIPINGTHPEISSTEVRSHELLTAPP